MANLIYFFKKQTGKTFLKWMMILIVPWFMFVLSAFFYCYEYFLRILPSVMTADLMQSFDISAATLGNLTAFYYYAYAPMQLPVGVLMDRFKVKYLIAFACCMCVIGNYMFVVTDVIFIAKIGRFFVGFGSAFAFVGVLKIATIWLPKEKFAMVSGMTTTLGMLGAMFGTLILTKLVELKGWQGAVTFSTISGVILTVAIILFLYERKSPSVSFHHQHIDIKKLYQGFLQVIFNKQIWLNGLIGAALYSSLSVFAEMWGMSYLQQVHNCCSMQAAKAVSMVFLGWAVGSPIMGWLSDYLQTRIKLMLVGTVGALFFISLILYVEKLPISLIYIILFGYGFCCSVQVLVFAIGIDNSPKALSGTAIAITNMIVMFSGMFLQPLAALLLDIFGNITISNNVHSFSTETYRFALSLLSVSLVFGIFMLFFIKETYSKTISDADIEII